MVKVEGIAAAGEFAPVVTNAVVHQTGAMSLPDAPLISLEEALTGTEDGRGFKCADMSVKYDLNSTTQLQLIAPGGEFVRLPRDNSLKTLQGSVILVRGVCAVIANSRRQLTGIEIWSPRFEDIQIEQSAPATCFHRPCVPWPLCGSLICSTP